MFRATGGQVPATFSAAGAAEGGGRAEESLFGAGSYSFPATAGTGGSRGAPVGSAAAGRRGFGRRGITEVEWAQRYVARNFVSEIPVAEKRRDSRFLASRLS